MTCARLLSLLACVAALAGCGAEERSGEVRAPPTPTTGATPAPASPAAPRTATPATEPPPTPTPDPVDPATATLAPEPSEANPGGASADAAGAGDEEPIRQPARFTIDAATVTPASVTVAPFLTVALEVANVDEAVHRVKLIGTDVAFALQPGQAEIRMLPGLKAGMYTLSVDGGATAAPLVVGDQAGP